jgi:hypothetical protein
MRGISAARRSVFDLEETAFSAGRGVNRSNGEKTCVNIELIGPVAGRFYALRARPAGRFRDLYATWFGERRFRAVLGHF